MKISELVAALNKVQQVAGDVAVVLYDLDAKIKTELVDLDVHIDPTTGEAGSAVVLDHAATPPEAPPAKPPAPTVASTAPAA